MWQMYGDNGRISKDWYTEEEVRQFLSKTNSPDVYAQNAAGDTIEYHDGPVTVARPKL